MKTISTKNRILAIIVALCATLICVATVIFTLFFNAQRTFRITETYRITSANGSETYLDVVIPMRGGYQEITNLAVSGTESYHIEHYDGWSELTAVVPANGSETHITISFSAVLKRNAKPWDGSVYDFYTEPQQYVDSDNEAIIKLGQQLRGDNDYQTAQSIIRHVNRLLNSPGPRENWVQPTASELLESPVGVCFDYAILMTALLRAEGIPARTISGLVFEVPLSKASDWLHPGGSHAWVEFYADGKWHFADPTWNIFDRSDTAHLSYGTYEAYGQSDFQQNRLKAIEDSGFFISGAMSSPLMFTVYSTDENATVVPRADVSFSWFR